MNLILLQHGYTITILKGDTESRLQYYAALEQAHLHNNKPPFLKLIATTVRESLQRILVIVGQPL
jgi:hypothetical protein